MTVQQLVKKLQELTEDMQHWNVRVGLDEKPLADICIDKDCILIIEK